MDPSTLDFIINHLFLPPKLPDEDDSTSENACIYKHNLIGFFATALTEYGNLLLSSGEGEAGIWEACSDMMVRMYETRNADDDSLSFDGLMREFQALKPGGSLALYIEGQNAGVVFQCTAAKVIFSAFEAAATNASVIHSKGRIVRRFPGTQVSIERRQFMDIHFLEQLADFLYRVNTEVFEEALPKARKAGQADISEERDTTHPMYITELLSGILRGMGEATKANGFCKNYRDDVIDGSKNTPWRRSPLLLVIKVALQMVLCEPNASNPHQRYKGFMLYLLSKVVRHAMKAQGVYNDMLFTLNSKLVHRIQKLGGEIPKSLFRRLDTLSKEVGQRLNTTWARLQTAGFPNWKGQNMPTDPHTNQAVPKLRECISVARMHSSTLTPVSEFSVPEKPRIVQSPEEFPKLGLLLEKFDHFEIPLVDIETWVERHLDEWLSQQTLDNNKPVITRLSKLYEAYTTQALASYEGLPEDTSILVLTAFHIWISLDKVAVAEYPFLGDFDPGFRLDFFEPLLLPQKRQLEQLSKIKTYINHRISLTNSSYPSPFAKSLSRNSFLVRYYDVAEGLAARRRQIEVFASLDRQAKLNDFRRKTEEHEQLTNRITRMACTNWTHPVYGYTRHDKFCEKHKIMKRAREITIKIHEWPLPEEENEARATISELFLSKPLRRWRDITYGLLQDICGGRKMQPNKTKVYTSHEYTGLSKHIIPTERRLCLASYKKPFEVTHYGNANHISYYTEESICKPNGLQYGVYDTLLHEDAMDSVSCDNLKRTCSITLTSRAYSSLQKTLDQTQHTTNEILADQNLCHQDLSLHEYYNFGSLRAGHRLQWRNIAREICAQGLNFGSEDVNLLISQAVWQVGPCGDSLDVIPESHQDLTEEDFAGELLDAIESAIKEISTNWKGVTAMRTYILLLNRILSLSELDSVVEADATQLLLEARKYCMDWIKDLTKKFHDTSDKSHELRRTFSLRILETCISCVSTFNTERFGTLDESEDDLAVAIECAIRAKLHLSTLRTLQPMVRRHYRILYELQDLVGSFIQEGEYRCASIPIAKLYNSYRPTNYWKMYRSGWLETRSQASDTFGSTSQQVCVNLLDGTILVRGSPLARLPEEYERHPFYRRLFDEKILDVVPSNKPGMTYMTSSRYSGNFVHFAMSEGVLVIRAEISFGYNFRYYEYIPHSNIEGDLPHFFVHKHVHWYLMDQHPRPGYHEQDIVTVEFRQLRDPWPKIPTHLPEKNGTVLKIRNSVATLSKFFNFGDGSQEFIDNTSTTGKLICDALEPIERSEYIHIQKEGTRTFVNLPRLNLDFPIFPPMRSLSCKGFRSMIYDEGDQNINALTGLKSKIVLRSNVGRERCVLIPYGAVKYRRDGDHVSVEIETGNAEKVQYFVYTLDPELGRLVGTGNLRSQLYKVYLHALTSHCLPDTLTGRTGTEVALDELSSAATMSFERLEEEDIKLLKLIGKLTPKRKYYPKHLKFMQRVKWRDLSPLSQHTYFLPLVRSIFEQAEKLQMFRETPVSEEEEIPKIEFEPHLQQRATFRNAAFYVDVTHPLGSQFDEPYKAARDRVDNSQREANVCMASRLVENWTAQLNVSREIFAKVKSWRYSSIADRVTDKFAFGFNTEFLKPAESTLPGNWCSLQAALSTVENQQKYHVLFFFSTMAYGQQPDLELIQTLLAFATVPELRNFMPPPGPFDLKQGFSNDVNQLIHMIGSQSNLMEFSSNCPEWHTARTSVHESDENYFRRRRVIFDKAQSTKIKQLAELLISSWSENDADLKNYSTDALNLDHYICESAAVTSVKLQLQSWYRNRQLRAYFERMQKILDNIPRLVLQPLHYPAAEAQFRIWQPRTRKRGCDITFDTLLTRPAPVLAYRSQQVTIPSVEQQTNNNASTDPSITALGSLLDNIRHGKQGKHEKRYFDDLYKSFEHLRALPSSSGRPNTNLSTIRQVISDYNKYCQYAFEDASRRLLDALKPRTLTDTYTAEAGLWPRLTKQTILTLLRADLYLKLSPGWKNAVIDYAMAFADLQHARRLERSNLDDLFVELANVGHTNWNPRETPEWLLFEIESNIRIRSTQISVADSMMEPPNNANSVVLFPIGKGKTSVVVPIVASALADGSKLVRVFVLKPLSSQMFNILKVKLGGMLNRRIYYLPFSRKLQLDLPKASRIRELLQECMQNKGILLVQPEHVLSLELMGYERCLAGKEAEDIGRHLSETQRWLNNNTRDILDESDEILNVKFELIYTIGVQKTIEFAPERWRIITDVLDRVRERAPEVKRRYSDGIELAATGVKGCFRRMRILSPDAGKMLLDLVTDDIVNGKIRSASFRLPVETVRAFITKAQPDEETIEVLKERIGEAGGIWNSLLLLKGLIADGILAFVFWGKRWRVNYGLDLSRSSLAVPYRGKDSPSTRAEFSHPDAAIALTALCYYYGGLAEDQLRVCFERILTSEDCQVEYSRWVSDAAQGLPQRFHSHRSINLLNNMECSEELFPHFEFAKSTIDFYLSDIVFPKEAKEYPYKLSASGWDIARKKAHPTTGFSGTNDSRYVLPTSIRQLDPVDQRHTNAEMLSCILKTGNRALDIGWTSDWDSKRLINTLTSDIRVIIDVGAQILDMKNEDAARCWLFEAKNPPNYENPIQYDQKRAGAVVFFNESSEMCVLSRDGTIEPLLVSPFAKKLDECLVYLDEVHTRGTDLALPFNYRAAVTLGVGLSKDRLVQACMRMRKLDKQQSVVFIAPREIQQSIHALMGVQRPIKVEDILRWSMAETCKETRRSIGLWYMQGIRHQQQSSIHKAIGDAPLDSKNALAFVEKEARSLEERYGGNRHSFKVDESEFAQEEIDHLREIKQRCKELGIEGSKASGALQEEQERELSPEAERQVQVERPPRMEPVTHKISKSLKELIETGSFPQSDASSGFVPAFSVFNKTTAAKYGFADHDVWSKNLLVTTDFATTVNQSLRKYKAQDYWLRPVHWVLSSIRHPGHHLIISPFEANHLLPDIRASPLVNLHVYSARVNRSLHRLDSLTRFSIKPNHDSINNYVSESNLLTLNLFAGQLYLDSSYYYLTLCKLLGIAPFTPKDSQVRIALDGFVHPKDRHYLAPYLDGCKFDRSPVPFLMEVLKMRRKGLGVDGSHMGRIFSGGVISTKEFEDDSEGWVEVN